MEAGGVSYGHLKVRAFGMQGHGKQMAQFVWDGSQSAALIAVDIANSPTYTLQGHKEPFLFRGKAKDVVALVKANPEAKFTTKDSSDKVRVFIRKYHEVNSGLSGTFKSVVLGGGTSQAVSEASEAIMTVHDTIQTGAGVIPNRVVEVAVIPGRKWGNATYMNRTFRIQFNTSTVDFELFGFALEKFFKEWKEHREGRLKKFARQAQGGSESPENFEHLSVGQTCTGPIAWKATADLLQ